ncbi:MAG TPA: TetR/AcrR family transcriptional regulator [Pseudonocardia sp.]
MSDEPPRAPRRMRADAAENRQKLLVAAKAVFTERGERASLNEVAKRAGVGSGTLYRHFPTLQALLVAIVRGNVDALCARGRDLLTHDDPDVGLRQWLREFAAHASTMNGLLATELAVDLLPGDRNPFADCHEAILATASELLARAQTAGTFPSDSNVRDVLRLVNAIAWASQQAPDDKELIDRLLAITFGPDRS